MGRLTFGSVVSALAFQSLVLSLIPGQKSVVLIPSSLQFQPA